VTLHLDARLRLHHDRATFGLVSHNSPAAAGIFSRRYAKDVKYA